jgi:predicted amidohydrolase
MRAALFQSRTGIDPVANALTLREAIHAAAGEGADMLFTPEMSNLVDRDRGRATMRIVAEADDMVLAEVRESAAKAGIWVQLGSLALRSEGDDGRFVNRGFLIDATGAIRARYDKMHLFDVDLPTGESWRESAAFVAGDRAVIAETPWGRLGLSICYDLRFPALYAALAEAGADMIAIPAAFTVPTGMAHWNVLLRARAIEAGVFVIAAAQCGRHEDGRETYGRSMMIDPWGDVLLEMGSDPGVGIADIEIERIAQVQQRIPARAHRRPIPPPEVMP